MAARAHKAIPANYLRSVETKRTQVSFTIDFCMQVDTLVELIWRTVETKRTQVLPSIDFYMQVAHQRRW